MGIKRRGIERISLDDLSCVTGGQIYSFPTTNNTTRYCFISRTGNVQYTDEMPTPLDVSHLNSKSVTRCLTTRIIAIIAITGIILRSTISLMN